MSHILSTLMTPRVYVTFHNMRTMLLTFEPEAMLFEMPLWKHAYHMLHSCDRWFINPTKYEEPSFHTSGLNSLDDPVFEPRLSREDLLAYLEIIQAKILRYMSRVTDAQWAQPPEDCSFARMTLLLGQFRHIYSHMGNINAVTMQQTGKWPRVVGLEWQISDELWENGAES